MIIIQDFLNSFISYQKIKYWTPGWIIMYANLLCQRLLYVQSKVVFFPSLTRRDCTCTTYVHVHTCQAYSRKGASKAKQFRGCERLIKNSLYDVWQFFNGCCMGAGFSKQNVAKNGDNLRYRSDQVNGKYFNTFKSTFMFKRTLYYLQKLHFNEWL